MPPGSVRVASSEMEQLASVAFLTPERKVVLVVSNTGNFPKPFAVNYHGKGLPDRVARRSPRGLMSGSARFGFLQRFGLRGRLLSAGRWRRAIENRKQAGDGEHPCNSCFRT